MDRDRRDDRRRRDDRDDRPARRDDRFSKDNPKHDSRDRSRSPPRRDRRDDRRRDRSPPRGPARGGAPNRGGGDRGRGGRNDRPGGDRNGPPRHPLDSRTNNAAPHKSPAPEKTMQPIDDEDEEATMARIMGFKGFRTTKNTKVPGNEKNYGVNKNKKTEYRQYMNRVGGFNRPLSPGKG